PFFNGPTDGDGQFTVYFTFEVTPKSTGKLTSLEEVGLYTVKNDKITPEQFFYDGER
ncbi:MAG: SnoaL-like domain-containing protein, partial [Gemmatimonadota bacterium]